MRNLRQNIKNLCVTLALGSYLFIITINVFHFHQLELGSYPSTYSMQHENKNSDFTFYSCPVQLAFNLLNNSIISNSNLSLSELNKYEVIIFKHSSLKIKKEILLHSSLRAPPLFS